MCAIPQLVLVPLNPMLPLILSPFSIAVISGLRTLMKLKVCTFFLFGRTLACYYCIKLSLVKIVNG